MKSRLDDCTKSKVIPFDSIKNKQNFTFYDFHIILDKN